jgi:hypothetical protein
MRGRRTTHLFAARMDSGRVAARLMLRGDGRHTPRRRLGHAMLLAMLAAKPIYAAAAQVPSTVDRPSVLRVEVLRGRVTTDSGVALPEAQITATMGPARVVRATTSDVTGSWSLEFPNATGDYLVHIVTPGRSAFRKRVTRGMSPYPALGSTDSVFIVDAALRPAAAQQLAAVRVQAQRPEPPRRTPVFGLEEPGPGAAERNVVGVVGAVPPDEAGNLAAVAATTPGIIRTGSGVSALGLSAAQTNVTLGALAFTGSELPRDARMQTRVATSTYDPTRGWFGGAQIALELVPGFVFSSRRAHLTLDAPALQATDAVGSWLGQRTTALQASVGGDGGFADDRWTYSYGAQVVRRVSDAPSLLDASPEALRGAGLAPDSAARLVAFARQAGLPLSVPSAAFGGDARVSEQASFIARIDRPFFDVNSFQPTRRTYGLTAFGSMRRNDAIGVSPLAAPARGAGQTIGSTGVQGMYSSYVGPRDWLLDVRSGFSVSDDRRNPYLFLPGVQVLVGSELSLPTSGIASSALVPVTLGGNTALAAGRRATLWETMGELQLYPPGKTRHRVTLTADSRLDGVRVDPVVDRLGTYIYQSLDDFGAGRPATFSRTLTAPAGAASVWNAFLAAGDYWRVTDRLQVMYGIRLEGNRYVHIPAENPALARAFGVHTSAVPNTAGLSPRLGFTWVRMSAGNEGYRTSPLGTFQTGAASVLRGGIGQFRNLLGPDLVATAAVTTGLLDATQRLLCVGSAVPAPQWNAWSAGAPPPASCAGGVGSTLADNAPNVLAFDRDYDAPRSWRANLSWSGARWNVAYTFEGIYSLNLNQPGTLDLNFAGRPRFTLADEGRPVYVTPASIDPATGALSPLDARRSAEFGRIVMQRGDLRSTSRQLTLVLAPAKPQLGSWALTGAYTLGQVRQQFRGFDGGTFGDPAVREWARGDLDVRHQVLVQAGFQRNGVSLTLFGHVQSGLPYAPLVGADVNGDGVVNDRAFVFAPAPDGTVGADAVTAARDAGLRTLLASAPRQVRECLTRALGTVVERNGCEGPWTAMVNARLGLSGTVTRLGQRVEVGLNFTNLLGGLDQLLHGSQLRGWGAPALPDPVLYHVRGFDSTSRRFRYEVNPRFGDTRPGATTLRAPFRVTLDVSLDIGRPPAEQQLDRWLRSGRNGHLGQRFSADELKRRYVRNVPDPYRALLQESDSLLLTREQSEALEAAQTSYRTRADSVWGNLAAELAALGDHYDAAAALKRQEAAVDAVWALTRRDVQATVPRILSPVQLRLAPWPVDLLLRAQGPVNVRVFTPGG